MESILGKVGPEAPLRLSIAAKLAFPDGSMTASGLRREAARGRLRVERIAGKDYTTLEAINRMRELCRVQAKEPRSKDEMHDAAMGNSTYRPPGSAGAATAISPQDALRARLKQSRLQEQNKP
jgi:hypothetical protein